MDKAKAAKVQVKTEKQPSTARAVFAGLFGVIAMLFFIPMVFSIWASTTLLNSANFSNSVTAIIINPKVSKQIAQVLTDSIVTDDTVGDLAQSVLTPEQVAGAPEDVKAAVKQVFNESLVQIIGTKQIQNTAKELVKKLHVTLIEAPPKDAKSATVDFRPFIAAVINGANGTKIAIITTKFTLEDGQGVAEITPDKYKAIQNVVNITRTSLFIQTAIFVVGSLLAVIIANKRFRALRRILLTCGILLLVVGLPFYLIPMILSGSSQADISATFTGARVVLEPFALTLLITGGLLVIGIIVLDIILKITSKKQTPTTDSKPEQKPEPKVSTTQPKTKK